MERHKGTIVHFAGDAVLAKFHTITSAVNCAVDTQKQLVSITKPAPQGQWVQIRIGINLGDVILDRDDIYGDGVNVAVRIQELADPGGICVSDSVRDAIGGNLPFAYEYLGEQQAKNIDRPIKAFRLLTGSTQDTNRKTIRASKPSIAVLPFDSIGNDEEGFSVGITEDVTRELSRFKGLSVISQHCSLLDQEGTVSVKDIGSELGVEYVLEGTVRKTASRVRASVELIETNAGQYLWGSYYDEQDQDVLDLQANIARNICATLGGRLRVATQQHAAGKSEDLLDTYDYVLRGQALTGDTAKKNREAEGIFARAIELDPSCARAYSGLAVVHLSQFLNDWADDSYQELQIAATNANKAIDCDDADDKPHWLLGELRMFNGDPGSAQMHLDKAMELNPNDTDVYAAKGVVLSYMSNGKQAVKNLEEAIALNPYHPIWYLWALGLALYLVGDYEAAVYPLREAIERKPDFFTPYQHLVAVYASLSKFADAREAAQQVLKTNPHFSCDTVCERHPFQSMASQEQYLEALRDGGLNI